MSLETSVITRFFADRRLIRIRTTSMSWFVACSTLATVYAISSFVFLRKPHWIYRRRRPAFLARHIAHRGGAGESIENSLLAFDRGLAHGVEMLELDCHLTKDLQAVVHHDASLTRTTGQLGFIRDMEYNKLPTLNQKMPLYYNSSVIVSGEEKSDLLRIPLLKDVFERYPTTPINLDIKENNDVLIQQVSDLIRQYHREHLTYWGSFSHTVCRKLTTLNPRIQRFCSLREVLSIVVAYWLGLLPFLPITPGAFEVPIPGEVFQKTAGSLDWKFKIVFYLVERALNNKSMFEHLQRRGIPVYVWILNNDKEFEYAFKQMSVTGIMTDYPERLQKYLASNQHQFLLE